MSNALDALMNMSNDDIVTYTSEPETEGYIVIGNDRRITVPETLKRIAVQYDHNIETVTFDCPRYWDDHDMSKMIVYINYRLPNGDLGSYIAANIKASGDRMTFDWTILKDVTQSKGNIAFLVCVKKTDSEGIEENHWNSELCTDMYISEGLEAVETVTYDYPDLVNQLLERMTAVEEVRPVAEEAASSAASSAAAAKVSETAVVDMASAVGLQLNETKVYKEAAAVSAVEASTAAASQVGTKADAIVLSSEGETITLVDSSDDPLRGLRVMGKTEQIYTTGKNQVDMSEFEFDDSHYTHMLYASNSASANAFYNFLRAHPGESIMVSMEKTGTDSGIKIGSLRFYGEDNVLICAIVPDVAHTIIELPETFTAAYIYGSTTGASVRNIQVEFGTEATAYEPYTGGIAAPNPEYPQTLTNVENPTVKVSGKNLFDMDKLVDTNLITKLADGTLSLSHYYCPTTLKLSALCPGMVTGKAYTLELDTDGNQFVYLNDYGKIWNHGASIVVTDSILNSVVTLYGKTEQVDGSTIIRTIQFRLTETPAGYEKYRESGVMSMSRTLRGIPVINNGNYTDSNGQQWYCDEIDFDRGVYIQRCFIETLTFTPQTELNRYSATLTHAANTAVAIDNGIPVLCEAYQFNPLAGSGTPMISGVRIASTSPKYAIAYYNGEVIERAAVLYPLATPIETALTAEELSAYKALHTNYPNTVVLNDTYSHMYLDYNADTKTYIDGKLDGGISAALEAIMNDSY